MLALRVLSAAVAIPLLVVLIRFAPLWLFSAFILALVLTAQWELYRMFTGVGSAADRGLGLLLGVMVVLAFAFGGPPRPLLVPLALSLAVAGSLAMGLARARGQRPEWTGTALTLLGVCYCAWLLAHVIWLWTLPGGRNLTLLLLGVTWCGETAAYFVGRRWGRVKLAPRVSPAKTVEGAVAQVLGSIAAALVGAAAAVVSPVHAVGIGLTLGTVGQVGDLAESLLKRSAATKDAGGLVPGHGGLLDRLDSLLFNVPALYYYVKLFLHG